MAACVEWAVLSKSGEIVNGVSTQRDRAELLEHVRATFVNGESYTVQPLHTCSRAVRERYRFWSERP